MDLIFEIWVFFELGLWTINVMLQSLPILVQKQCQSKLISILKVGTYYLRMRVLAYAVYKDLKFVL